MKRNYRHTWIFRCFDFAQTKVSYKVRCSLTVREAKSFANELMNNTPGLTVNLFKKINMD